MIQEMAEERPRNSDIATHLRKIADLLEAQGEGEFRVSAYRRGADAVEGEESSVAGITEKGGEAGLTSIGGIGSSLAGVITEFCDQGSSSTLERLRSEMDPERLFEDIPGVGPELAANIVEELDIRSLEELEAAAHDGRLEQVEGFGGARVEAVRELLDARLRRRRGRRPGSGGAGGASESEAPPRRLLLEVDAEYREKARRDELPRIAPRRFNPAGERWLPMYRTRKEGWEITALFSNTARAHREGKTRDWVVIYWKKGEVSGQNTVITAEGGGKAGSRVVAGR